MSAAEQNCDVLVIGGGPAGSTTAALLAARGLAVTLLEKDKHPRFHIGESLLPMNLPLLEQMGLKDKVAAIGMLKPGIEFVAPDRDKNVRLDFARAWGAKSSYSFQVRRSTFDHILIDNAAQKGAAVIEECRADCVEFDDNGVTVAATTNAGDEQVWRARFLVDATGRDTLLATHFGIKQRNRRHNSAALFGHFTGAQRLPGRSEGNISIFLFEHGWFWFIPLADGATSVGAVCTVDYIKSRKGDVTAFFMETIALCPKLAVRLANATLNGPATATGNYSYRADRMAGKNYLMVGDAYAFIDPVFSTGVYIAMRGAFLAADTVMACLEKPHRAAHALGKFDREVRRSLGTFSWFIYRINKPALRDLIMAPKNVFRMVDAIMAVLAGDVAKNSPIRPSLFLFRMIYYVKRLFSPRDLQSARGS